MVGPLAYEIVDFYGQNVKENAQRFVPIDTQATWLSIHTGDAGGGGINGGPVPDGPPVVVGDGWSIDIGPTTYYAPFLEWGTVHMAPRPFMLPALGLVEQPFVLSMFDLAKLADQFNTLGKASESPSVRSMLNQVRSGLYTTAKFMGDINAIVPGTPFGGRSALYGSARLLGDVNSVIGGTVRSRISRRMAGRVTGRLAGVGSASLSASATYSGLPGGSGGVRIYNRISGRVLSSGLASRGGSLYNFPRLP